MRLRHGGDSYWDQTYVVDEVLQSGTETYTVFLIERRRYVRKLRERSVGDLAPELLELARQTKETVDGVRRRRRKRYYVP